MHSRLSLTMKKNRVMRWFKRVWLNFDDSSDEHPVQVKFILTLCDIAPLAFGAYKDPMTPGFADHTTREEQIRYLNPIAGQCFAGVLKIYLKSAKNVRPSDIGWLASSDPYVQFSVGSSYVRSGTIRRNLNPEWNSIHYLIVRKKYLRSHFDDRLRITLFDDDADSIGRCFTCLTQKVSLDEDDIIGSASIVLSELTHGNKKSFSVRLATKSGTKQEKTTIDFSVEFISFEKAWKELDVQEESLKWIAGTGDGEGIQSAHHWLDALGRAPLLPIAFIESKATDTQAWVCTNPKAKTLLVSFRGTELDKIQDAIMDLRTWKTRLRLTCLDIYNLKINEKLKAKDIYVHEGFMTAYESVREALLQVVYDITGWSEDWDICITGHSLGGALATLCAFEFANRLAPDQLNGPGITMINFGAPRVGNEAFADLFNDTVPVAYRVVEKDDIVHLVPPFYMHTAKEVVCCSKGSMEIDKDCLSTKTLEDLVNKASAVKSRCRKDKSCRKLLAKYRRKWNELPAFHSTKHYSSIIRAVASEVFRGRMLPLARSKKTEDRTASTQNAQVL